MQVGPGRNEVGSNGRAYSVDDFAQKVVSVRYRGLDFKDLGAKPALTACVGQVRVTVSRRLLCPDAEEDLAGH